MKKKMHYISVFSPLLCVFIFQYLLNSFKIEISQSYHKGALAMCCGWETKMHKGNMTHSSVCITTEMIFETAFITDLFYYL